MRFRRWPRVSAFNDTPRKRAALARSQKAQQEKFPLLREIIAEQQASADTIMAERAERWDSSQQDDRDRRAQLWRRARAQIAGYGDIFRRQVIALWNNAPYPADPVYLLDFLRSIETGRIDPGQPPWRLPSRQDARASGQASE